ncbi:hypothetical protein V1525DRAFT_412503 [Lipomyces kononenkoae]|uniref:Uncharacterized protein n=1 Tax=Lipomyces kononenkoae TaxID=34357 RepID=A0ACC3SV28_LIPKO
MAPVKERLLRISVAHYRNQIFSEAEFHRWATGKHCAKAAGLHARYNIVAYGMVSTLELVALILCNRLLDTRAINQQEGQ